MYNDANMKTVFQGKTKTGEVIAVRYPEMGDAEEMLRFINEISDEKTFVRYQGEHETLESEEKYLANRLKAISNKKAVHLLAFSGSKLIGGGDVYMMDKVEKHIGVFGILVAKDFRTKGVGGLLADLVVKEAFRELADLRIITLEVFSTNEVAKNLYKKMGFVDYGLLPEGIIRNGRFEDGILMYKKILR